MELRFKVNKTDNVVDLEKKIKDVLSGLEIGCLDINIIGDELEIIIDVKGECK